MLRNYHDFMERHFVPRQQFAIEALVIGLVGVLLQSIWQGFVSPVASVTAIFFWAWFVVTIVVFVMMIRQQKYKVVVHLSLSLFMVYVLRAYFVPLSTAELPGLVVFIGVLWKAAWVWLVVREATGFFDSMGWIEF